MNTRALRDALSNRRNLLILVTVTLALLAVLTWWLWPSGSAHAGGMQEITVKSADGREGKVRLEGIGALAQNPMQDRLAAYFALQTKAERDRFLDAVIDETQAAASEVGDLAARVKQSSSPEELAKALQGGAAGEKVAVVMRPDDKSMAENVPAEFQARMAEFAKAVSERRRERGMPPGPLVFRHRL